MLSANGPTTSRKIRKEVQAPNKAHSFGPLARATLGAHPSPATTRGTTQRAEGTRKAHGEGCATHASPAGPEDARSVARPPSGTRQARIAWTPSLPAIRAGSPSARVRPPPERPGART
jgi:hypothetical protein